MANPTVRIDLRAALPVVALGVVILVIIFVELCGREDVAPLDTPAVQGPTATAGPTFTPGPSPTVGPSPTAQIIPGSEERDATRIQHLAELQDALAQYLDENGSYPDTDGNIQTLCSFLENDVGCELEEFLSPLPEDPLGNPVENGYWYASAGRSYFLFAQRESDLFPECDEQPDHLADFDSVFCFESP